MHFTKRLALMALWWNSGHSMFFETLDYYIHDILISRTPIHSYARFTCSDAVTLLISLLFTCLFRLSLIPTASSQR
jgi:hypothetical protein